MLPLKYKAAIIDRDFCLGARHDFAVYIDVDIRIAGIIAGLLGGDGTSPFRLLELAHSVAAR